jgi:hypothetical protein
MPSLRRVCTLLTFAASAQLFALAASAQDLGKLDIKLPEMPAELKGLKSLQQIGGACDVLFNRTTKTLVKEYFGATDSAAASSFHEMMRELAGRRHALDAMGVTGMGIVPADIPVIQQVFRAPNMSPAGMERAFLFCDALGDSLTATLRQGLKPEEWREYQAAVSKRTLKALLDAAPKD